MAGERLGLRQAAAWLAEIIGPDKGYINVGIVYTLAITLLSLATPISVQLLINSVARTALVAPLWILSGVLLALLLLVAGLSALRVYLLAMFERRIFARVVAEVTVRAVHAQNPFFADESRGSLFNRYFDMVVVQKAVPSLVIGAFTIILQGAVGLIVTSFYHPFFLAFNIILVGVCLLIWLVWRHGAITGAVGVSHAKHEAAHWLESVGASNGFYKSARHLDFAMDRSETVTANYIRAHRHYFRYSFAQALGYFLVYAFAAAALLALGGLMVFDDVWFALLPAALQIAFHLVEANVVTPMLLGRRLTMNPLLILVSLTFWGWVWGTPGALLGVPLLIILQTVVAAAGTPDIAGFLFEQGTLTVPRMKENADKEETDVTDG